MQLDGPDLFSTNAEISTVLAQLEALKTPSPLDRAQMYSQHRGNLIRGQHLWVGRQQALQLGPAHRGLH